MSREKRNKFCEECVYLSLTEIEQDRQTKKEDHRCSLFDNIRLFHHNHHTRILRCSVCIDERFGEISTNGSE